MRRMLTICGLGVLGVASGPAVAARAIAAGNAHARTDAVIARLAAAAKAHPLPLETSSQFVGVRETSTLGVVFERHPHKFESDRAQYPTRTEAIVTCRAQRWTSPARRGSVRSSSTVRFLSAADRRAWVHAGRPTLARDCPRSGRVTATGYEACGSQSTRGALLRIAPNPSFFYRHFCGRYGSPASTLHSLGNELATQGFPPGVRVTAIRALADFPGIRVAHAGPRAVVLQLPGRSGVLSTGVELDPSTGAVFEVTSAASYGWAFLHGPSIVVREADRFAGRTVTDSVPPGALAP